MMSGRRGPAGADEAGDGALPIRSRRDVLKQIQASLRAYAPEAGSVTDELITERRSEGVPDSG